MKRFLKFAQRHPETNASALGASASVPASGFAFIDNSTGASATVAELSRVLGGALESIDLDGDVSGQVKPLMDRLDQEASKYNNAQLEPQRYPEWECSAQMAELVSIAWKCASGAYDPSLSPIQDGHTFTRAHTVKPSAEGTVKAMTSTIVTSSTASQSEFSPLLVIAIRGSADAIDHMVNANGKPRSGEWCINNQSMTDVQGHSGFLNSAEALESIVSLRINEYIKDYPGSHRVLFTGHSAGGAVASLLYLRHLSSRKPGSVTKFSCITYGAPPCLTIPFVPHSAKATTNEVCINIINEFDLVTRIDEPYVLCLANLARLSFGQPALPDPLEAGSNSSTISNISLCQDQKLWPMPASFYHHIGTRVIFSTRLDPTSQSLRVWAVEVPREAFEELLFCRLNVHRRTCYGERVQALLDGKFAGKTGR